MRDLNDCSQQLERESRPLPVITDEEPWGTCRAWFFLVLPPPKPVWLVLCCSSTWAFLPLASDCGCGSPSTRECSTHPSPLSSPSHPSAPTTAVFIGSSSLYFSDLSILRDSQEQRLILLTFIFSAIIEANNRNSGGASQSFAAIGRKMPIITVGPLYPWILWTQLITDQKYSGKIMVYQSMGDCSVGKVLAS